MWSLSVLKACMRQANSDRVFTNQGLIKDQLPTIIKETKTNGKTPANTMSRSLQELRDFGFIQFTDSGSYKLMAKLIDFDKILGPRKNMSKGEKLIASILEDLNIKFETEKTFADLKHKSFLRFDFYFVSENGHKFAIEFDGQQHYKAINFFGGQKAFEELQYRDLLKDTYCKNNNITLIRFKEINYAQIKKEIECLLKVC